MWGLCVCVLSDCGESCHNNTTSLHFTQSHSCLITFCPPPQSVHPMATLLRLWPPQLTPIPFPFLYPNSPDVRVWPGELPGPLYGDQQRVYECLWDGNGQGALPARPLRTVSNLSMRTVARTHPPIKVHIMYAAPTLLWAESGWFRNCTSPLCDISHFTF